VVDREPLEYMQRSLQQTALCLPPPIDLLVCQGQ
jgi:hypothetical protein